MRWLLPLTLASASAYSQSSFDSTLLPILKANCLACHYGPKAQAGLDLTTFDGALKGGKSGAALKPGSAERSLLVMRIVAGTMPPGGKKLNAADVAAVRAWIDQQPVSTATRQVTEADVIPIFQMRCVSCHGKRKQEGGLDLRTMASRLKGGKSGPAMVPGDPQQSLILKRIAAGEMPPPKSLFEAFVRPPTSEEVDTLRAWINAGAPPEPKTAMETLDHDPLVSEKDRQFWSFRPPVRPAVPTVRNGSLVRNPIDAFLLEKLESKGLTYAPPAARLSLMRRAFLDLTGLVPTPAEIDAYEKDARPDAYERLIDRLLDSRKYAERWAQFWLNAAGYADSEGIIDEDLLRPNAWRYRDAVIRAFQKDKPYDVFLTEQLAGDELIDYHKVKEVTPEILDTLASTGFLRMAPDGTYSPANGSVAERMNVIADEIEVLASSVMGLTVGCARCHNHKYDPIPQRDYYRLGAILQTAYDPYDWAKPTERNLDIALASEREAAEKHNSPLEAEIKRLETAIEELAKPLRAASADNSEKKSFEELAKEFPAFKVEYEKNRKAFADAKKKLKPKPQIRGLYDMGGDPSPAYLLRRGEAQALGERVQPDVPSVLRIGISPYQVTPPREGTSGNRLALARWLTQPNHPLTARVMVNRIWMHHFGRGIVVTPANFGRLGAPPTHPELLDWLALEFVRGAWSIKAMHRLIMTSAAYRQSSRMTPESQQADPENHLLSRMALRRMDAEQLYDSLLQATGRLSGDSFGPPVSVETKPGGEVVAQGTKEGWRRAIYALERRTTPVTMLEVFDLPPLSPNCIERAYSTVSTQALQLRNSAWVLDQARFLAARLIDELGDDKQREIAEIYRRTVSRPPSQLESDRALASIAGLTAHWEAHFQDQQSTAPRKSMARWYALADFCHAMLSSAEFSYAE
jgi:mono/diheme cytochrome c family protein